ncbi:uncharacterized protein LOC128557083 [Mercenaria mercenaria]|uniref:uncharacterized protein LOC128557083 n=1 Tax=Mercenaria mercenaria TaxID=6596 RepID=UPI00234E9603|nr:uncharacterized protein LOC128557083 [Mercenaria mercenaria]
MSDIHSNEAIERLRQKVKAADDFLHDVLRMVETVSTQQKDINSMNMKLKESVQKISTLEVQLDKSVSARTMQSKEIQIQQDKLERSKEECQKLSDLNRVVKEKAREYEQKLRDLESSKDEIMKYMKYKDLKIQHLESDAVQHEHKIGMLENVLEIQKSKLNELRMELENSQRNKREKLKLFGRNEEEMPSLCSTTEPIHPDRKLEKENKELKINVQEKEEMLAVLKKHLEEKENKVKELEDEIIEMQERANTTMKKKSKRKTTKDSGEIGKLKRQLMEITTEKEIIKGKMEDMENDKDAAVAKKVKEIMSMEKERNELLCRQSERTDRRLIEHETNIADLSDLNRPTKLAEKYAELYDNEWTDAYSYLETLDAYKGSEVTAIASLLTMLTTAYKMSLETAESQLEALHHILSDFQGSIHQDQQVKDVIMQLKDQRKRTVQPSKDLTEKYRKEIENRFPNLGSSSFESDALKLYLQKCIELCWLMAIQDPPVHLKCEDCKKGDLFDKNMYKEYTQSGPFIAYTVWPAVLLEKDGALICKGVVQCDKRLSSSLCVPQGKIVVPVSKTSSYVHVRAITKFPTKNDISDKVDRGAIVEPEKGHSGKRTSQPATDDGNTGVQIQESKSRGYFEYIYR